MRTISSLLIIPALVMAVACKGNSNKQADSSLNNDLSAAGQAGQDTVSSVEQTPAAPASQGSAYHHHHTDSYSSSSSSQSSQPSTHVVKHGGRDAAIGAGAGALLGAATSRNKLKGGVIGAAAGGILGAVVGNNVDKQNVPNH